MIITRTPFRVSFCGGGSDLASFYERHEGCVLSTTINKYMYISIHPFFEHDKISLKYKKTEFVNEISEIDHPIFKEALKQFNLSGVEISSTADIPSGTGLGSSSAFTVGLLNALNAYTGKYVSKQDLAENACDIEINRLKSPIGKQDQYAVSFGGLNFIRFLSNGVTVVEPVIIPKATLKELQRNILIFYTGKMHNANTILKEQNKNTKHNDKFEALKTMCSFAIELKKCIEKGNLDSFGEILHENWMLKRQLASGVSSPDLDRIYEIALKNGALGGKLLGAGGGGFFLFYCPVEKQKQVEDALGLPRFDFSFEQIGTSIVYVGDKYWE